MLAVEDEGDGISPAHLPHVFDRFYKADASRPFARPPGEARQDDGHTATSGGSGLGLSIVKAIVERHGGSITVRSRPGCTVFEITLSRAHGWRPEMGRTPGTTRAAG
jgi:signal transduction histidine kinase